MPHHQHPVAVGLDFGTEAVRAILIDSTGTQLAACCDDYQHGQIIELLPGTSVRLPERYALQAPDDWITSAARATRNAIQQSNLQPESVIGIGVDFTSCTMLPALLDGTPLCAMEEFRETPLAWPKLWKHHGAITQTQKLNDIARQRDERFLRRYGGTIGLEWFFPKMLETIEEAPHVASRVDVWLEAGDWFVWQLVGGSARELTRSTCQAGYKAMWSADEGYPSLDYFDAVDPRLSDAVRHRMPGIMRPPGECAGRLIPAMADRFGLKAGTPVSTAIIDAHSAVPGVGAAEPGTLVMVMGTSSCHMLNAISDVDIDGIAGVAYGGILPGLYGYETGQAAVGDAFAWLKRLVNVDSFDDLARRAIELPAGAGGVRCLDWMNGCRTPLMDGSLRGVFSGLSLSTGPEHLYLALMEASAFGLRWIVDLIRSGGIPVNRFVATGGLPHHNRAFVEVYADVLGEPIEIHPSTQGPAVGAAVLGMLAAGRDASGFDSVVQAARAMANPPGSSSSIVEPRHDRIAAYQSLYRDYRRWADTVVKLTHP